MTRSNAHLVSIIAKHTDMTERLNNMLDRPLYLLLNPAVRREMQAAIRVAITAAKRVVEEETAKP